jgi:hypothetical protein
MTTTTTAQVQLVNDVTDGFMEALEFVSEYHGEGYDFTEQAQALVGAFVRLHLDRFDGINWQAHGDATQLGRDIYYTSAGHGCGFWDGCWGEVGDALDKLTVRHDFDLYLDDDYEMGLV